MEFFSSFFLPSSGPSKHAHFSSSHLSSVLLSRKTKNPHQIHLSHSPLTSPPFFSHPLSHSPLATHQIPHQKASPLLFALNSHISSLVRRPESMALSRFLRRTTPLALHSSLSRPLLFLDAGLRSVCRSSFLGPNGFDWAHWQSSYGILSSKPLSSQHQAHNHKETLLPSPSLKFTALTPFHCTPFFSL